MEAWGSPGTRGRPGETTCGVLLGQARELRQSHRSIQNLQAEGLVEEFGTCSQATLKKKEKLFCDSVKSLLNLILFFLSIGCSPLLKFISCDLELSEEDLSVAVLAPLTPFPHPWMCPPGCHPVPVGRCAYGPEPAAQRAERCQRRPAVPGRRQQGLEAEHQHHREPQGREGCCRAAQPARRSCGKPQEHLLRWPVGTAGDGGYLGRQGQSAVSSLCLDSLFLAYGWCRAGPSFCAVYSQPFLGVDREFESHLCG